MTDTKISADAALVGSAVDPVADVLPILDISAGLNKKITVAELVIALAAAGGGGTGVPNGGTVGQTLVKQSATNGDAVWKGVGNTTIPAAGAHAYWRIAYVSGNHGTFLSAFDIQFRQVAGVTEHPTGGSTVSTNDRPGFVASDAFDANDTTRWALDNYANIAVATLGYHYATPISVAQVRMFVSNGETPNSYNIQYSDNGTAWTTALAVTGQTNWATEVLHDMPTTTVYGLVVPLSGLSDVLLASLANGQTLAYDTATSKWKNVTSPYDLTCFVGGKPLSSEIVMGFTAPRNFNIPAGAAGSYARANTAAAASTTFDLRKNGTSFGSVVFAAAGTVATITVTTLTAFVAGDLLTIVAPATPDTALSDIGFTFAAVRT